LSSCQKLGFLRKKIISQRATDLGVRKALVAALAKKNPFRHRLAPRKTLRVGPHDGNTAINVLKNLRLRYAGAPRFTLRVFRLWLAAFAPQSTTHVALRVVLFFEQLKRLVDSSLHRADFIVCQEASSCGETILL
jgi:hypothetical protein